MSPAYFCLPFCSSNSSAVRARFWMASRTRPRSMISRMGFFYIHRLHRIKKNNLCNLWIYPVHAKLGQPMLAENLYALPIEQQIGQFLFIGLPGTELDPDSRALIEYIKPGGVIIFGRNVAGP